ncbi:geranylgeranyl transferase type-2 subunit alpha [Anopheles bellator]|uniref:geranylgeranyl transferase type-2 subunit alpha n=1 Tax=Anopheles bellator TaxID=139047 RepID=UPI00264841E5|nr:geranylgeranyl transferase type-2 subunit alpha [Anopheles bellator]
MHGRLKVRTSAEEAARKKKAQEEKVVVYRAAIDKVLAKKAAQEFDPALKDLTSSILGNNPDIATLWNVRRMCILKQKDSEPEAQKVFDDDLEFTEMCLRVNPKSYCAWHHRCWILENAPTANWQKEVDLCTKYLKLDERNFHCWDYRRYVVAKAQVPPEQEFAFCTEKIEKNFSNYSSWHYRSQLLPLLAPHTEDPSRPISEEKLKEELELVLTAAFTDPNDSSAWFYQRWLLGYTQPELDLACFRVDTTERLAVVSFTKPIQLAAGGYRLTVSGCDACNDIGAWKPVGDSSSATTWVLTAAVALAEQMDDAKVTLVTPDGIEHHLELKSPSHGIVVGVKMPKFGYEFGSAIVEVLKAQLMSCQELLGFEPDSKWTLLTAALLMKAIDRRGYYGTIRDHLAKLESVDSLRRGYYRDLASKWAIEKQLELWIEAGDLTASIDLAGLDLTVLNYSQYLATTDAIDLSHNRLVQRNVGTLRDAVFCRRLNLSENALETDASIPKLPLLTELSLEAKDKSDEVAETIRAKVSILVL